MDVILSLLFDIVLLMCLSAFFSAAETAMMSLDSTKLARMRKGGNGIDKVIVALVSNPQRLLSVVLVGNMFVNVFLTATCATMLTFLCFGQGTFKGLFTLAVIPLLAQANIQIGPENLSFAMEIFLTLLNIAIVTPVLIVLGELTPKNLAIANSLSMARIAALPLKYLSKILLPIVWILEGICIFLQKLLHMDTTKGGREVLSRNEINATINDGAQSGSTSRMELRLLKHVVQFDLLQVQDIMTPNDKIVGVTDDLTLREAYVRARLNDSKYIPVCRAGTRSVIGALCFTDYPRWIDTHGDKRLSEFNPGGNSPIYSSKKICGTVRVEWLLSQMRNQTWKIVIVEDTKGNEIGVLTLEDILEKIISMNDTNTTTDAQRSAQSPAKVQSSGAATQGGEA